MPESNLTPMDNFALWTHALDYLHATDTDPQGSLAQWRAEVPKHCTDADLFREYAWVVACCGLTPQVVQRRWDRLGEAFFGWDPTRVSARSSDARIAALELMRNPRKIHAILAFADDLNRAPGLMARLSPLQPKEALAQLTTLPFVGPSNKYHLARNLGWDVVTQTGPVTRLAAYLETTPEELCQRIGALVGERGRTVDLVLWHWGHQVGDQHMKEMASLFRLM